MTKVLFVCMGNICRSPTAEGVFRKLVREAGMDDSVQIASAGTHAYHVGEAPDLRAQQFGDDLQLVEIELDPGEGIRAEAGTMTYMENGIEMQTGTGGGIFRGLKRIITGESFFISTFQSISFTVPTTWLLNFCWRILMQSISLFVDRKEASHFPQSFGTQQE